MVRSNRVRWILSSKLVGFPLEKFALKSPISFEPPFQGLCWICAPQIFLNVGKSVWSTYTLWFSISAKDQEISEWKYEVSNCPKYDRKFLKNSAPKFRAELFKFFCSDCGQCDDFKFSFWNFLTFSWNWKSQCVSTSNTFPYI